MLRRRARVPGDVSAAMTELAKWQHSGYAYINDGVVNRTKRADFLKTHQRVIE